MIYPEEERGEISSEEGETEESEAIELEKIEEEVSPDEESVLPLNRKPERGKISPDAEETSESVMFRVGVGEIDQDSERERVPEIYSESPTLNEDTSLPYEYGMVRKERRKRKMGRGGGCEERKK